MSFSLSSALVLTSNLIKCRLNPNLISTFGQRRIRVVLLRKINFPLALLQTYSLFDKMDVVPFSGLGDRFDGVTVDSVIENCSTEDFLPKLEKSLQKWENKKKRGIWFKVALEHATWVPILAKSGFDFHHATNGSVVMYKWLPKDEECNIPTYAHTMIGVGAVVINDASQILVVREKYWHVPHWKLPGGYVESGENIADAAIREVFEETNIRTEFCSLISLRHAHKAMFDCSDIYFVVSLKPLTTHIEKCGRELLAVEWLDVKEYLNHSHVHELNRFFVQCYLDYQKHEVKIDCKHGLHQLLNKPYTVYYTTQNGPTEDIEKLKLRDKL